MGYIKLLSQGWVNREISMMIFDTSFGIDFKQNHLVLTLLKKSFGKIRLVDFGIYPLLPEAQKEEREAQMIGKINSFISQHHVNKERVSISIPREKVVARFIQLPIATKENLRKVIEYEVPKYTPFEKEEIYFDFHLLKQEKDWLHLFAVFVKRGELDYYVSFLKRIGIQPISIQIPSTAALNLFFYHKGSRENEISVLLDETGSFFEMNVIQGKEDWRDSFHLPLSFREKESKWMNPLKQSGITVDSFSKATFYVYGLETNEKTMSSLKKAGPMKDVSPPPMNRIVMDKGLSNPSPIYASVGLPLKGLTKTRVDLNLLPLEMRKKMGQIGKPLFIILFGLTLVLCLTWGTGVFFQYRNALHKVTAEIKQRRPEVEKVEKLQKEKEIMAREIFELDKIKSGEIPKIEMLKELTQLLPSTVWIWNLKYNGKEIEISGFADSASDLIPLIDKSPLFEKVEFLAPVTKEKQMGPDGEKEKERFKIKARIESRRVRS
jgi:Tfp pilus assembly protein PilN